jgi:hypothetical protein
MLRTQDGDLPAAVRAYRGILNTSRSLADNPTLIGMLVRIAIRTIALGQLERILAQGQLPETTLASLQKELETEDKEPLMLVASRGERAGMDCFFQALEKGKVPISGLAFAVAVTGGKSWGPNFTYLLYLPRAVSYNRAVFLERMNTLVAICQLPQTDQPAQLKLFEENWKEAPLIVRMLSPAVGKGFQANWRNQANLRCSGVALAVERFRLQQGRWPDRLEDLVPALLQEIPRDPFDGAPLRFRRDKEGVAIYSVGPDGKDDGGAFDFLNTHKDGTDFGFRLWDISRRRQPAPKK